MSVVPPVPATMVVYAKDIARVAAFYQRTLCLSTIEEEPGFVVVGDAQLEIAVVRMPEARARDTHVLVPPQVREGTAVKFSFLVDDFERVHREAVAAGGDTKRVTAAWSWRGQIHLDALRPGRQCRSVSKPEA